MIVDMSTSLKVVSMAAAFCASLRRRAIVWRSLVMRTRSSRRIVGRQDRGADRDRLRGLGRREIDRARMRAWTHAALDHRKHVAFGYAAVFAGPADGCGIDAAFLGEPAHGRGARVSSFAARACAGCGAALA